MKGTVVYAERRKGKNGGAYVRVGAKTEDGETYFFNVKGEVPEKGELIEIPASVLPEEKAQPAAPREKEKGTAEERMNRSVALKAAAQVFSGWAGNGSSVKAVLELAEEFLQWLQQ